MTVTQILWTFGFTGCLWLAMILVSPTFLLLALLIYVYVLMIGAYAAVSSGYAIKYFKRHLGHALGAWVVIILLLHGAYVLLMWGWGVGGTCDAGPLAFVLHLSW